MQWYSQSLDVSLEQVSENQASSFSYSSFFKTLFFSGTCYIPLFTEYDIESHTVNIMLGALKYHLRLFNSCLHTHLSIETSTNKSRE